MDIRLCCVEAGEGFPLVLLHGNGEDHTYFKRQMGPFSQHFRVIAVDTRGHGESPRGTAPFTLEQIGLCAILALLPTVIIQIGKCAGLR